MDNEHEATHTTIGINGISLQIPYVSHLSVFLHLQAQLLHLVRSKQIGNEGSRCIINYFCLNKNLAKP